MIVAENLRKTSYCKETVFIASKIQAMLSFQNKARNRGCLSMKLQSVRQCNM